MGVVVGAIGGWLYASAHDSPSASVAAPALRAAQSAEPVPAQPHGAAKSVGAADAEDANDERRLEIAASSSEEDVPVAIGADTDRDLEPASAWQEAVALEPSEAVSRRLWNIAVSWLDEDPQAALDALDAVGPRHAPHWRSAALGRWARKDLQGATAWVLAQPASSERVNWVGDLAELMAQNSPQAALRFADRLGGRERQRAAYYAFSGWSEQDPRAAMEALAARGVPAFFSVAQQVVATWAERDASAAFDWLMAQPRARHRETLVVRVLEEMAWRAPEDALTRAQSLRGREREQGIAEVLGAWAKRDHRAAADWIGGNDRLTRDERLAALWRVLRVWADVDADAALDWLLAQPQGWHDAVTTVIDEVADDSPSRAAGIVERLPDPVDRSSARFALVRNWADQDPASALRWVADLADVAERRTLYSLVFEIWAYHDRESAAESISLLRPGKDRDMARRELIETAVDSDADFAEDLYLRINDAEELRGAAMLLHHHWRDRDPRRARRYRDAAGLGEEHG